MLNRLQYVLLKEAINLVEEGVATPEDVDTIVRTTFGYRLPFFGPFAIADMAGLDVYRDGFRTLQQHYGERLAAPKMLIELVSAGRYGVKQGGGFVTPAGDQAPLVAYRNTAYARLGQLLKELGPAPKARRRMISSPYTAEDWPIAAAMLPFGNKDSHGGPIHDAEPEEWAKHLRLVRHIGFTEVDPTDTWVRVGDLSPERLADFKSVLSDVGLTIPAISTSRRSVMDPEHGEEYLAYSHRLLDVAAELGVPMVSFGFFQEFTAEQQQRVVVLAGRGLARRRVAGGAKSGRFVDPRAGGARSEQRPADHSRDVRGHLCRDLRRRCEVPRGGWTRRLRLEPRYRQLHPSAPSDRAGARHARQGPAVRQLLAREELPARRGPDDRPGDDLPGADGVRLDQLPCRNQPGPRPRLPRCLPVRALRQRRDHRDRQEPRLYPRHPRHLDRLSDGPKRRSSNDRPSLSNLNRLAPLA